MTNKCPYCGCEMDYLEVVREEITWDGDSWQPDKKAVTMIRCPECGDELEAIDLGILGCVQALVEMKIIKRAVPNGEEKNTSG